MTTPEHISVQARGRGRLQPPSYGNYVIFGQNALDLGNDTERKHLTLAPRVTVNFVSQEFRCFQRRSQV